MAILRLEDGTTYTQLNNITRELASLNIHIERCPVGENLDLPRLLAQDILSFPQKEQVLQEVSRHFEQVKLCGNYQWRDLMVLHPGATYLYALITHLERFHTQVDDEALYILAGEGIFGFVRPDGSQVELIVQAEDYINVPSGTEHWFCLTASLHIKAVRYFTTVGGWTPQYTHTEINFYQTATRKERGEFS